MKGSDRQPRQCENSSNLMILPLLCVNPCDVLLMQSFRLAEHDFLEYAAPGATTKILQQRMWVDILAVLYDM